MADVGEWVRPQGAVWIVVEETCVWREQCCEWKILGWLNGQRRIAIELFDGVVDLGRVSLFLLVFSRFLRDCRDCPF